MGVDVTNGHAAMDYTEHMNTYRAFIRFTKYAIVFLVILLAGMKFFLV